MGGGSMFGFKSPGWADHAPALDEANRAICSTAIGVICAMQRIMGHLYSTRLFMSG